MLGDGHEDDVGGGELHCYAPHVPGLWREGAYVKAVALALLLAVAYTATATGQLPVPTIGLSPEITITPGAAQGRRGDLVHMPAGTIQGVHVIQGGSLECDDPDLEASSGCDPRRKSFALDIGAGSATDRGWLALQYDVGRGVRIFDGYRHRRVQVDRAGIRLRGRLVACDRLGCVDVLKALRARR